MNICLIKNLRTTKHNHKDRRIIFCKLVISLLKNNYLVTTKQFAYMLKSGVEKLITIGKRNNMLHNLRTIISNIHHVPTAHLIMEKSKEFANRNSGYISICKFAARKGDGALQYGITWSNRK